MDTLQVKTGFVNRDNHPFNAYAIFISSDSVYSDSIQLFDDGMHGDGNANDGIWGNFKNPITVQKEISLNIRSENLTNGEHFTATGIINFTTITSLTGNENKSPKMFSLNQNYPNPFNPSTTIEFILPKSEFVKLKVYNILGKELFTLVSKKLNQGNHTYTFNGSNLASGVYYYQLVAGDYREVKKMIILR
jgi:hypothetical protein